MSRLLSVSIPSCLPNACSSIDLELTDRPTATPIIGFLYLASRTLYDTLSSPQGRRSRGKSSGESPPSLPSPPTVIDHILTSATFSQTLSTISATLPTSSISAPCLATMPKNTLSRPPTAIFSACIVLAGRKAKKALVSTAVPTASASVSSIFIMVCLLYCRCPYYSFYSLFRWLITPLRPGLLMNSEVWVCLTEKERCLPFQLVDHGYDVWVSAASCLHSSSHPLFAITTITKHQHKQRLTHLVIVWK